VSPRPGTVRRSSSCSPRQRCTPTLAAPGRVTSSSARCPGVPERHPGRFVVDLDGAMVGQIILSRATGHGPAAAAGKAELGYLFLPQAWGFGYAAEACAAALGWFAGELHGEPVVLFTQTANVRSMRLAAKLGFTEVERYEAYGAEQWFGMWSPVTPPD